MIKSYLFSGIEQEFFLKSKRAMCSTNIPYIVVPNFPTLGFLTALKFLEWVDDNPNGVISLPTGKTPEHFIKWTKYLLDNFSDFKVQKLLKNNGLKLKKKPKLSGLYFVQIDEFYPIDPKQHNSFYNYVNEYYIEGFGLDKSKALLMNSNEIELAEGKHFSEVFPDSNIDLSLRNRTPNNELEKLQQESIYLIDDWCSNYESKIRKLGGIGFFLGGIGPDGHIAFNIKGSDHNSTTRLTQTNFETQAASAGDLGGIEVSRNRLVITIGLGTITYNPDGVSIIFAAGEAKANIVKNAIESEPTNIYPATVLQRQNNARFYITDGAASQIKDSKDLYYSEDWSFEKTERSIYDYCKYKNVYSSRIDIASLKEDSYTSLIPNLDNKIIEEVVNSTKVKISKGLKKQKNQRYLHTGPHHDDIMLGIFPDVITQLREPSNEFHFAVLTSGFTAVTNHMMKQLLNSSLELIENDRIQMLEYPNFYTDGYKFKWDKDVSHYLNKVSERDEEGKLRGVCHRIIRSVVSIYGIHSTKELKNRILSDISILENSYDGEKNSPDIQKLKGMLREFEEELVWAHFGVPVKNIEHLRLGFYSGDIFTEEPSRGRDVEPILDLLRRVNPTRISVAFDPEGSGPDTHYKVLQAIAEALRQWSKEKDLSEVKVIGYRNVWYKFHPAEANVFLPVSLNSLAILENSFKDCYISQVNASFPSPYYDGPFSNLSQKIWSQQFKEVQLITGKSFFYENESHKIRATHGMIYYKEMKLKEFLTHARKLEKSMEGSSNL
ncbi:MAG: glucosamine-6-phosphate isomerase [Bacteroidetes bacterium]|nr:MAG: glucosamine-6-phosphate isomerase [Bacteroidota bacterium]